MENQETMSENKVTKMKLSEAIKKSSILKSVLLAYKNKELSSEIKSRVMMNRIYYGKYRKQFDECVKEAEEALKPEGFDEQMNEAVSLEKKVSEKNKGEEVTEEMMKEALTKEELAQHKNFMAVYGKYNQDLTEFKSQKLDEEIDVEEKKLTQKEFDEILNVNTDDTYKIDICVKNAGKNVIVTGSAKSEDFMEMLYEEFVE